MKSLNTCMVSQISPQLPLRSYENTLLYQVVLFCQFTSSLSFPQLLDNNPVSASISLFPRRFAAFQVSDSITATPKSNTYVLPNWIVFYKNTTFFSAYYYPLKKNL